MTTAAPQEVDLDITGMTCASCSARIEKKLNRLEGVEASVNLATEKAHVRLTGPVTVQDLLGTVEELATEPAWSNRKRPLTLNTSTMTRPPPPCSSGPLLPPC